MLRSSNAAGTHDWFSIHDTHLSDKEGRWVGHFSRGRSTLVAPMLLTPHDDNWLACVLHALVFDRHDRLTPAPAGGDLQNSSDTLPAVDPVTKFTSESAATSVAPRPAAA